MQSTARPLKDFVVSSATDRLRKEIHERLNRGDAELDPISASEHIFKEV